MAGLKTQVKADAVAATEGGKRAPPGASAFAHALPQSSGRALPANVSHLYRLSPHERIAMIRKGIAASTVGNLAQSMRMSKDNLLASLGLSRATISRKEKEEGNLSKDESERLLGVATLIGIVQTMVEESGEPAGFDSARWVADWLSTPLPALAGATPSSYLDTFEGQKLLAELLGMIQSGAYA